MGKQQIRNIGSLYIQDDGTYKSEEKKKKHDGITEKSKTILKYDVINKIWPYVHILSSLKVLQRQGQVLFLLYTLKTFGFQVKRWI